MIKRFSDNTMIVTGGAANNKGIKEFASGKRVCEFGVAADYRDGATVWCTVKAWGLLADKAAAVQKGDQVLVTGRYEERTTDDGKVFKACVADAIVGVQPHGDAYEAPEYGGEAGAGSMPGADDELPY